MTPLEEILEQWRNDPSFMANVACWEVLPEQAASYADMPAFLDDRLKRALKERGIEQLYLHQAEALQRLQEKENIVVVTPHRLGEDPLLQPPRPERSPAGSPPPRPLPLSHQGPGPGPAGGVEGAGRPVSF